MSQQKYLFPHLVLDLCFCQETGWYSGNAACKSWQQGFLHAKAKQTVSKQDDLDDDLCMRTSFAVQVVFGGAGAQGPLGDLWLFDLTSRQWTQPTTQGDPPALREMHTGTMVDETRMLIYGGRGPDGKVRHWLDEAVGTGVHWPAKQNQQGQNVRLGAIHSLSAIYLHQLQLVCMVHLLDRLANKCLSRH